MGRKKKKSFKRQLFIIVFKIRMLQGEEEVRPRSSIFVIVLNNLPSVIFITFHYNFARIYFLSTDCSREIYGEIIDTEVSLVTIKRTEFVEQLFVRFFTIF